MFKNYDDICKFYRHLETLEEKKKKNKIPAKCHLENYIDSISVVHFEYHS